MKKIMKVLGKVLGAIAVLCLCIITVLVVKVYNRESRVREYEGELKVVSAVQFLIVTEHMALKIFEPVK